MKKRVLVITGNGKGKTTAAFGGAFRAVGQGMKVLVVQFVKGGWTPGEITAAERLKPDLEVRQAGLGFVKKDSPDFEKHREAARNAVRDVEAEIDSDQWDLLVLDEINWAVHAGLVLPQDVVGLIQKAEGRLHLILTGRHAHEKIIQMADTVTELKEVKHAYEQGVKAVKGIEF